MTTTPTPLNPQIVGQAEKAHKPVLERVMARTDTLAGWFSHRHLWSCRTVG
jgi:hypothetical protein